MLDTIKRNWVERQKKRIEFCIEAGCWSGVDHHTFVSWLQNFPDDEGEYYALRLLYRFIYYSETDTVQLCRHGLLNLLLSKDVLMDQISSDFNKSNKELKDNLFRLLESSRIVPLLDKDKPYESGPVLTRILVQKLQVPGKIIINPSQILEEVYRGCKRIIIIDDCVGSGNQIKSFWKKKHLPIAKSLTSLEEMATNFPDVDFYYLALVAAESGIKKAGQALPRLHIIVCETLTCEHRVFSTNSRFFASQEERGKTIEYLENLLNIRGVKLKGYAGLDYAVAFHHNLPNWALPLFYKRRTNWRPLVTRKDSDA